MPRISFYGRDNITFGVGHDFIKHNIDLCGIVIPENELETINRRLERFCKRRCSFGDIGKTLFVKREFALRGIRKIYGKIRLYQQSQNQSN